MLDSKKLIPSWQYELLYCSMHQSWGLHVKHNEHLHVAVATTRECRALRRISENNDRSAYKSHLIIIMDLNGF